MHAELPGRQRGAQEWAAGPETAGWGVWWLGRNVLGQI